MGLTTKISINKDIKEAFTLPSVFYIDEKYFDSSINNIFANSWQLVYDINLFPEKHVFPYKFLNDTINEPIIITKNNKDISILSNVCTHRGSVLCDKENNNSKIQCKYHGRTFNLKGDFLKAPGFEQVKNFPTKKDNLKKYPFLKWMQFIFCSLGAGINIEHILKDIECRLEGYPFDKLTYDKNKSKTYLLNAHWALYCENYLEGFHVPFIHKGLNNDIDAKTYKTEILTNGVLQYTKKAKAKDVKNKKSILGNVYAYYYWIFPNIMLNFYDWGLSINVIEPITKNKTKIRFLSYPFKGSSQPLDKYSGLDKVEREDQEIIIKVQEGIKSKSYSRGRYSAIHEKGLHYFHQLISKYIN